jgi:hypothetical protein
MSQREAARQFNISRGSVAKRMAFSVPPGYRRQVAVKRPKLDGFTGIIDGWLEGDREVHHKQRHTAKRVFERLRAEHAFTGGYTIVKGYLRERQRRRSTPAIRPPDGSVRRHWCATRPMITRSRSPVATAMSLGPGLCRHGRDWLRRRGHRKAPTLLRPRAVLTR